MLHKVLTATSVHSPLSVKELQGFQLNLYRGSFATDISENLKQHFLFDCILRHILQ